MKGQKPKAKKVSLSLPDDLLAYANKVSETQYGGTLSRYVQDLIRRDQEAHKADVKVSYVEEDPVVYRTELEEMRDAVKKLQERISHPIEAVQIQPDGSRTKFVFTFP